MIYLSFGVPKSASSFVFQMTRELLDTWADANGAQRVGLDDLYPGALYAEYADAPALEALDLPGDERGLLALVERAQRDLASGPPRAIIIKTHLACAPDLRAKLDSGGVLASATFRHPAEAALSLRDMRTKEGVERTWEEFKTIALSTAAPVLTWAESPETRLFHYDDIAERPQEVEAALAEHIGIEVAPGVAASPFLEDKATRIWQFNKGVTGRRHTELEPDEVAAIERAAPELSRLVNGWSSGATREKPPTTRFGVVTPVSPGECLDTLDDTVLSSLGQRGSFSVDHHVVLTEGDDAAAAHLERWRRLLEAGEIGEGRSRLSVQTAACEVTAAIGAGLDGLADADIYTVLLSGQTLEPGALQTVSELRRAEPSSEFIIGSVVPTTPDGVPVAADAGRRTPVPLRLPEAATLERVKAGHRQPPDLNPAGVFWTRSLWWRIGREIPEPCDEPPLSGLWRALGAEDTPAVLAAPLARSVESVAPSPLEPPVRPAGNAPTARLITCSWPDREWVRARVPVVG